jgi:hypothetical protein
MAYTGAGELIEAWDYNRLAWGGNIAGTYTSTPRNLAYVWGVGNGAFGYGQDVSQIPTVSTGGDVTAAQWSQFIYALNKTLGHQSGAGGQLAGGGNVGVTAGATIQYFANVATAVTTVNTNAALFSAQGSTTTGGAFQVTISSTTGISNYVTDRTVTFASANAARYFFNAGGSLRLVLGYNSGNGSGATQSFQRMVDGLGGVNLFNTTNSGRSGTGITLDTNNTAIGYRNQVFNSATTIVQVTDTGANYGASTGYIQYFTSSNDTTNGANGSNVIFRTVYTIADKTWDDTISVNYTTRVDIIYPETTYLTASPASWGIPSVT